MAACSARRRSLSEAMAARRARSSVCQKLLSAICRVGPTGRPLDAPDSPADVTGRAVTATSNAPPLSPPSTAAPAAALDPVGGRKAPEGGRMPPEVPSGAPPPAEPVGGRMPTGSRPALDGGLIPGGATDDSADADSPPLVGGRIGPLAGTGTATGPRAGTHEKDEEEEKGEISAGVERRRSTSCYNGGDRGGLCAWSADGAVVANSAEWG